mmetsp:Transcript_4998/g.677  ORF Transcript_4998/g.677 Transcript_4998/m.677 type:complete len:104 (-) Transcript_4998:40-351(-)
MLPEEISFNKLKPGDLIFYSATYYNPNRKVHPHNMTHVEIFLGGESGEESLGSRISSRSVQIFDSYKFVSQNYYNVVHHYKSIDVWLKGILRSYCSKHYWHSP